MAVEMLQSQQRRQPGQLSSMYAHAGPVLFLVGVQQLADDLRRTEDGLEYQVRLGVFEVVPRTGPILWWASAPSAAAAGIDPPGGGGQLLFQAQVQPPVGDEVVVVGEPLSDPQTQSVQADLAGIVTKWPSERVSAVLDAVDDEPVQILISPTERGLQDRVQFGDAGFGRHEQAPPDHWADPVHHRPELVDGRGCGGCGGVPARAG